MSIVLAHQVAKIILAETNVETFNTFVGYAISFRDMLSACFKVISQNCQNGFTIFLSSFVPLNYMIIARFSPLFPNSAFLIKKSCAKSTAEKQSKIWKLVMRWSGRDSVGASSFGWFLGGFGRFLLAEGDFRWFKVVCCFSSYINFTAYRTLNSLLYSWSQVIDWGHSIFLFKVKLQEKNYCCLVA